MHTITPSTGDATLEAAPGRDEAPDLADSLEAALRGVSEGVMIETANGRLRYANEAALELLGVGSIEELRALPRADLEHRFLLFDASGAPCAFDDLPGRRVLAGEDAPDALVRFRRVGAEQDRWAMVRASPVRDRAGRVRAVVTLLRDVTEALVAAERLRFQAGLLDELDSAVVVTGVDGLVRQWSRGAERLFGIAAADALNRHPDTLFASAAGLRPRRLLDALTASQRWSGEIAWRRPDRRFLELHATARPIQDPASRPAGTLTVLVDLSRRRRAERRLEASERRLRELADLAPQLVWTVQPRGRLGLLNRRWREYVGDTPESGEALGWDSIVHPDDLPEARRQWRRARRSRARFVAELRLRRVDGAYRWHLVDLEPIVGGDRRRTSWIGTAMDVDEHRRAEEWLRLAAEASRVLDGSIDPEAAIAGVAAGALGSVADWLAVHLLDDDTGWHRTYTRGADARAPGDATARVDLPVDGRLPEGVDEVVRTKRSLLLAGTPPEIVAQVVRDEDEARRLVELGARSALVVPLLIRGRGSGALTFGSVDPERPYGRSDLAHAEDLARRVGEALERMRLRADVSDVKATLDATLDSVVMFDPRSLRITYANRGACDQLGYAQEQLLRMSKLDLMPEFDEPTLRDLVGALIRERAPQQLVTLHRRRDGTHLPVELSIQYVEPEGGAGRVVAVARDISERVRADARLQRLVQAEKARASEFQAIVRAIGEAVFVCARDGTVTFANDTADALFGEARIATYAAISARMEGAPGVPESLDQAALVGPLRVAVRGRDRWLELSVFPVGDEQHLEPGEERSTGAAWIVLLRDVTASRRAEMSREALISVLSHELRTPVTTIYGASMLLGRKSGRIGERQRSGLIADIQAESDRLHRLVEDLLVLARQGGDQLEAVGGDPLLLQRVIPTVLHNARRQWPGVRFVRRVPGDLPTVSGDATYVEQIVRNLLSNAIKYSPAGSPVVVAADAGDTEVRVRVLDRGPGIDPHERERLFEPFFRSPRLSSRASGAGIGLFVCRQLAEAMGGRVWAAHRPRGGAEFGFALRIFAEVDM